MTDLALMKIEPTINQGLVASTCWAMLGHMSTRGCLMLAAIILARSFSTDDFAAYSYFQITITMLAAYASMGLGVSASRYFAAAAQAPADQEVPALGLLWALSGGFSVLACVLVLAIPADWLDPGFAVPRWMLALGVLTAALQIVPGGAILGLEKYKHAAMVSIFSGSVMLIGTYLSLSENSLLLAMSAVISANLLQLIGETIIVVRAVGLHKIFRWPSANWQSLFCLLDFAGPMLLVSILAASGSWILGRLIIQAGGDQSFALYSIGMQWFAIALVLPGMVSRVLLPRIVRTQGAPHTERQKLVGHGALLATSAAACIFVAGVFSSQTIFSWYGGQYADSHWLLLGYLAAAVLLAPANTLGNAIVASNGHRIWLLLTAVWLSTLLAVGWLTISYGAWSGAIAQSSAAAVLTAFAMLVARMKKLM